MESLLTLLIIIILVIIPLMCLVIYSYNIHNKTIRTRKSILKGIETLDISPTRSFKTKGHFYKFYKLLLPLIGIDTDDQIKKSLGFAVVKADSSIDNVLLESLINSLYFDELKRKPEKELDLFINTLSCHFIDIAEEVNRVFFHYPEEDEAGLFKVVNQTLKPLGLTCEYPWNYREKPSSVTVRYIDSKKNVFELPIEGKFNVFISCFIDELNKYLQEKDLTFVRVKDPCDTDSLIYLLLKKSLYEELKYKYGRKLTRIISEKN